MRFAIDDFGVGFSSISYLQDMPVRMIKTDASFSEGIDRDERSCALLCSITMMGQALGLDVVVEGIERDGQLDHLRDHVHAPFAQGYLMHRPMSVEALVQVLRRNRGPGRRPRDPGGLTAAQSWRSGISAKTTSSIPFSSTGTFLNTVRLSTVQGDPSKVSSADVSFSR